MGGPTFDIEFPVGVMGGVDSIEGASPGTILKMRQKATDIKIKPGTHVSAWTPIQQMFVDSLMATDLDLNWEEIDPIQVRWAIKADPDTNLDDKLCLVLEGIPCKRAELESLKPSSKGVVLSGAGVTFLLWSAEACWHAPYSKHHLNTMPGIYLKDRNRDRVPTDMEICWFNDHGKELSRRGTYLTGGRWAEYWANPTKSSPSKLAQVGIVLKPEVPIPNPGPLPGASSAQDMNREGR